jgi:hypothetical protein
MRIIRLFACAIAAAWDVSAAAAKPLALTQNLDGDLSFTSVITLTAASKPLQLVETEIAISP